ncbi:MAG: M16 family metallopeptidase [Bacteroidota bacterium]|jgi:zinc protease
MLVRDQAPAYNKIDKISITEAKKETLDNGISVYSIDSGSQELVRVEFNFKGGSWTQSKKLQASHTLNMLENGTANYTADEISEHLDFYGSFFEAASGFDRSLTALYSLNKHLDNSIGYVEEIIKNPTFPKDEYDIFLENSIQRFLVNSKKVSFISKNEFASFIFGDDHPYNNKVTNENFKSLTRDDLTDFYGKHFNYKNCSIIISGRLPSNYITLLNNHFGTGKWGSDVKLQDPSFEIKSSEQRKHLIVKEDAIQSSIRIGRSLFNKKHPDYFKFQLLNTVLGGYFGSRLMSNIREDKGYTYGIGSGLVSLINGGYFFISTEVGIDVTQKTLDEIYFEIKRLREELIPEEELKLVKNYFLGSFLRSIDGPFALAEKFKAVWEFGMDYNYYTRYIDEVSNCTAEELLDIANKYLQEEDLIELVVGKK